MPKIPVSLMGLFQSGQRRLLNIPTPILRRSCFLRKFYQLRHRCVCRVAPSQRAGFSDAEKPHLQGHRGESKLAKEKTMDNTSGPVVAQCTHMPLLMSVSPGTSVKST